ncbi:MAG TPA: aminopeptidase [Candidatus Limnocylindrales bacterium]|nr:aminopeptidase [Candidatus Limnocylindrales bacterium]
MLAATLSLFAFGCSGCRAVYVTRLAYEQARYLASAESVEELIARTEDPERRKALELVLEAREFARRSGLEVGGSYRKVANMKSASPFHVVTAAYADRLEPYTWWYPVVGAIPYRGYFEREAALEYARELEKDEALDTAVVEASAYSTLGWFADPLPSTVVDRGTMAVATTVLHELVHQTLFIPGQVAFNETLATAVAYRLADDFFAERGEVERAERLRRARAAWVARSRILDDAAATLKAFFERARQERWPRERMLEERTRVYEQVQADAIAADPVFAAEFRGRTLHNATFLAIHRYATRAAEIEAFLDTQPSVKAALDRIRELTKEERDPYLALQRSSVTAEASAAGSLRPAHRAFSSRTGCADAERRRRPPRSGRVAPDRA